MLHDSDGLMLIPTLCTAGVWVVWLSSLFSSLSRPALVHGIYVPFLLCHIPYVRHVLYIRVCLSILFSMAFLAVSFQLLSVLLCFMSCL